ncbi:uncharacterized protein LOC142352511 isoform X1 [Convolutriloba macropyga]|uniref:uncharacterized protein LOC142352511 isoform X1 n=1 Tax=Convolutriloba macropyga TaxID=536237 RepID=UPI003F51F2F7
MESHFENKEMASHGCQRSPTKHHYILQKGAFVSKGPKSGKFLHGNLLDLHNMERAVNANLYSSVKTLQITKSEATGHIRKFFEYCKANDFKPMLYYTGHGEENTGNWCFSDGKLGFEDILNIIPAGMENPTIICDTCYSGRWAYAVLNFRGKVSIACRPVVPMRQLLTAKRAEN